MTLLPNIELPRPFNSLSDRSVICSNEVTCGQILDEDSSPERPSYDQNLGTFSPNPSFSGAENGVNNQPGFPDGPVVKNLTANAGDTRDAGLILGSSRLLRGGNDNPLQYSCLENPMDRGA